MKNTATLVGIAIKRLRKSVGKSQVDLAKSIGISQTYLSQIENGSRNPTLELIGNIADYFSVSLSYLFSLNDPNSVMAHKSLPKDRYFIVSFIAFHGVNGNVTGNNTCTSLNGKYLGMHSVTKMIKNDLKENNDITVKSLVINNIIELSKSDFSDWIKEEKV